MHTQPQKGLEELYTLETQQKHCFFVYLKLIALPFGVFVYFLLGFLGFISLKVGIHSIVLIGLIFGVSLLFARHNGEFGACYFRRLHREFRTELEQYIHQNVLSIGVIQKSNASFEDFIAHFSKRIRNDNYASIAGSIFPTMGILGTFISIALTLPDFSSQTAGALEKEITLLLSGVGTAFYVSIYGIFLSLWWTFFEKKGINRFEKEIERIKEENASLFWTKEEIEQAYLKENLQHFEKISHMFEKLSAHDFFERLGKSIEDKFSLFDQMLTLEAKAVKMGAEHLKEGMDVLSRSREKQHDLITLQEALLEQFKCYTDATTSLHVKMNKEQSELLDTTKEMVELLKECPNTLSSSDEVASLKESLKIIDAETEEIIQKMDALK